MSTLNWYENQNDPCDYCSVPTKRTLFTKYDDYEICPTCLESLCNFCREPRLGKIKFRIFNGLKRVRQYCTENELLLDSMMRYG